MSRDQEIMDALMAKFYQVLTAGDTVTGSSSPNLTLVSFASPGLSVTPEELSFSGNTTAAEVTAASAFADIVNSIPSGTGFWRPTANRIWDEYLRVLNEAILPVSVLTPTEELQLERARNLLWSGSQETQLLERYRVNSERYLNAQLAYNSLLITLQNNPNDPQVASEWPILEPSLRVAAEVALNVWIAEGRFEVEAALATIAQLSRRDPFRIWQESRQLLEQWRRTDVVGQDYFVTNFVPGNFHLTNEGWSRFTLDAPEVERIDTSTRSAWGGGAPLGYGLWSLSENANDPAEAMQRARSDIQNFSLEMEFKRVPLRRPWFTESVLTSRAWRWPSNNTELLSDGRIPPSGSMVAYPVDLVLVRNLVIQIEAPTAQDTEVIDKIERVPSAGWGVFRLQTRPLLQEIRPVVLDHVAHPSLVRQPIMELSTVLSRLDPVDPVEPEVRVPLGSIVGPVLLHKQNESGTELLEISQPGMQIIAFVCRALPKRPDPDLSLTWPS